MDPSAILDLVEDELVFEQFQMNGDKVEEGDQKQKMFVMHDEKSGHHLSKNDYWLSSSSSSSFFAILMSETQSNEIDDDTFNDPS